MDVNKELGTAAIFAQAVWILAGLYLYFTTPGASLLSNSAGAFLVGGFFASALIFGVTFYGLRRAINSAPVPVSKWVLTITEAVVIFVAAGLTFEQLERFRAGVPLEYAQHRDDFDYALIALSVASGLEEQA